MGHRHDAVTSPLHVWFVGVNTSGSSALTAFPAWMDAIGLRGTLEGVDLPLDAAADAYCDLIRELRGRGDVSGAVITAHKAGLFEHTEHLLDGLSDTARLCREVSVLRRRDGGLHGDAIEPWSVARSLEAMLEPEHWRRTGGELVVLGAGGTAFALLAHLFGPGSPSGCRPRRVRLLDLDVLRAETVRAVVRRWDSTVEVSVYGGTDAEALMIGVPAGSLVVNATGVGKDRPGSPVPLPVRWPERAVVWDLNYRGELAWLRDAEAVASEGGLAVHDGWLLFLHGWSEALGSLLGRQLTRAEFAALREAAEQARTR